MNVVISAPETLLLERRRPARFPVRGLLAALLRGDEETATDLVQDVLLRTGSRTAVFADLLHPAQTELADLWYAGRAASADEVRVAAAVRRMVRSLPATPAARPVSRGARCVLAMPKDDPHDVGLSMLALALQDHGWTIDLVPPGRGLGDAVDAVVAHRPNLLCLSAGHLPVLTEAQRAIAAVRAMHVPVLVGGVAFNRAPDLWRRVGAQAHGSDVRMGVVLARRLCGR